MASPRLHSWTELELIERRWQLECRENFLAFRQYMRPGMKHGWWQTDAARELLQWLDQFLAGRRPILVIQAPPQHGKSLLVIDFLAWLVGRFPDLGYMYASVSKRLGTRANKALQRFIDSPKYAAVFPGTRLQDRDTKERGDRRARNENLLEFMPPADGSFRCATVGGTIVGEGLHVGVIDDPIKGRTAANSPQVREGSWNWLNDDFFTRFDDAAGMLAILTRWHLDDPIGRLLEADQKAEKKIRVLTYPALADDNANLMPHDPRKPGSGEALFPEHKSREFLLERKARMRSDSWESLYQQNPFIVGGDIFHAAWWQYWKGAPPKLAWRAIYVDTAQKEKEQHDFSVLQCWGKTTDGRAVLLDQIRGKWESPDLKTQARAFWNKHHALQGFGTLRAMKVEDKVSGTGLIQELKRARPDEPAIPVAGIPRGRDKIARAHDVTHFISAGLVMLPAEAPWLSDYLLEFSQFPNVKHDDQVDPTIDAIGDMLGGTLYNLDNVG